MSKPKVLFVCDVRGWAWYNKSIQLKKYLSDDFDIDIICTHDGENIDPEKYDVYFTYGYSFVKKLIKSHIPYRKRITGLTAHKDRHILEPSIKEAYATHANSKMLLNYLKTMHGNTYYLPNGVDEEMFHIIEPIPEHRDNIIVGHIAKENSLKGHNDYIKPAIKASNADHFYHHVNHQNKVPHKDMVPMYQKFDCFIVASIEDGTPNPCCTPNMNIDTIDGLKLSKNIKIGDEVLTHLGEYRHITKVYEKEYNGDIIRFKTMMNSKIHELTQNHKVLAIKSMKCSMKNRNRICKPNCMSKTSWCKKYYEQYEPEFIPIEELNQKDFLMIPREKYTELSNTICDLKSFDSKILEDENNMVFYNSGFNHKGERVKVPRYHVIDKDFMRLLGYYLAEGSVSKGYYLRFALHKDETYIIDDIENIMFNKFGIRRNKTFMPNGDGISVCYGSKILSNMFKEYCGIGSHTKKLHKIIYNQNNENIIELLKGYFLGDGHLYTSQRSISTTTSSKQLSNQLRKLFMRLDVVSNNTKDIRKRGKKTFIAYKTDIKYPYSNVFLSLSNIDHEFDRNKKIYFKHYYDENYVYVPITMIEKVNYKGSIYNFEVEDHNSYTVNTLAVHNCLEAAACGRPIISNLIGNMPEFIKNGYNGFLLEQRDINKYVEKINWFRDNRDKMIEMGLNARKTIEDGWTWKIQSENYRKMIWDVVNA